MTYGVVSKIIMVFLLRQFDDFLCPLMDNLGGNHSIQNHNVTKNDYDFSIVRLHPPRIIVQSKGTEPKDKTPKYLSISDS